MKYFLASDFETFLAYNWKTMLIAIIPTVIILFVTVKIAQHREHKLTLHLDYKNIELTVEHGKTCEFPPMETKRTFKGWFRDAELTIPFETIEPIYADTDLYAKFE